MSRKWKMVLLALALCVQQTVPAAAMGEAALPEAVESEENGFDIAVTEEPDTVLEADTEELDTVLEERDAVLEADTEELSAVVEADAEETDSGFTADGEEPDVVSIADTGEPDAVLVVDVEEVDTIPATAAETGAEQAETPLDAGHFPDDVFRKYLVEKFDSDGSGGLSADEIAAVTEIDVIGEGVSDLTGLAYFTALTGLYCDNNNLTALDVSANTKLGCLTCSGNRLTDLNLEKNTVLFSLVCSDNQIKALNLSKNVNLQDLRCAGNALQTLDISGNPSLVWMDCSRNGLTALDASGHEKLQYLFCSENQLASLNVSKAVKLQWLECQQNLLTGLDISDALNVNASNDSAVNLLNCADNQLTSLAIGDKQYFKGLVCSGNAIAELDLTAAPDLRQLECAGNALTSLDLTENTKLQTLDCSGNQLTALDLRVLSITETSVLPNCSGQKLSMSPEKTENGIQIDLKRLFGDGVNIVRMSKEEFAEDSASVKSAWGNVVLLSQGDGAPDGELTDGVLTFADGQLPETIEFFCATGYRKKAGEKDVLLGITLRHTHDCSQTETKEPSCTENGYIKKLCAECGAEVVTVLPAKGHVYDKEESEKPTCTEAGYVVKKCSACGETLEREKLQPKGHSYQLIKEMPTCTENGWMYRECSVCGQIDPESKKELPMQGHKYEPSEEILPSCTKNGVLRKKCLNCGDETETVLPALGHRYEPIEEILPGCTEEGLLRQKCQNCGDETETVLPAKGHSYGAYTVMRKSTIFEAGEARRTCSVCSHVESMPIAKLDGTVGLTVGSMPIQITEKVSVQSLVTGLQADDYVTSWSSGNPEIATISADGTITAKKTGNVDITVATKSGATAAMTVKVQTDKVVTEDITGLEKNVSVSVGEKLELTPVLTPISSQQKVTYKSSNKKVATVSAKGVVKGVKKGSAKITVKSGDQKFVVKVKVTAAAVKKIKNIPAKKTLRKGKTYQLKPRLTPVGCSGKISYKSSNKKVATVTAKGKITARRKGTVRITVKAGNKKAVCKVTVK